MHFSGKSIAMGMIAAAFAMLGFTRVSVAEDQPVDVSTAANVDENLFLERAIASAYNQMPQDMFDAKAALKWCEETRLYARFLRKTAVARGLDSANVAMIDDLVTLIDAYEDSLATLGDIDRNSIKDAIGDAVHAWVKGSFEGLKNAEDSYDRGESKGQQTLETARGLFQEGLKDYIKHSNESRSKANDSAQAEQDRFFGIYELAMKHNGQVARAMSKSHDWADAEAGFDGNPDRSPVSWVQRRPRDPFARAALAMDVVKEKPDPEDYIRSARLLVEAARLVPADSVYDGYRTNFVSRAAWFAATASSMEIKRGLCDTPTKDSQEAINLVKAWLAVDPEDPESDAHMQLSRVLGDAGRIDEALAVATPLINTPWGKDLSFDLRYTLLAGNKGDAGTALIWLDYTLHQGFGDLAFVKNCPDLDSLRTQKPKEYADLMTAKGGAWIVGGLFFDDDIAFKNHSAFPMTNVTITATAIKGDKIWHTKKQALRVNPDETYTFENVFNIPDGKADTFRWRVTSDQGDVDGEQ